MAVFALGAVTQGAKQRLDSLWRHWFGQVMIKTGTKRATPILLLPPAGCRDQNSVVSPAQLCSHGPSNVKAADIGQTEIQHQDIGLQFFSYLERSLAGIRCANVVPREFEKCCATIGSILIVIDD
jgi:hypothetical protein